MGMIEDALREYAAFEDRSTDPSTPAAGSGLVFFKDGKLHTIDDAGTVVEYGAGGGGGGGDLTAIATVTNASTAAIDFTAIPDTYRHLLLVVKGRSARAGNTSDAWICRVGNTTFDSGNNYSWGQNTLGTNSQNATSAGAAQFQMGDNGLPGATAVAGRFARLEMWFYDYASTGANRDVMSVNHVHNTASVYNMARMSGQWLNTADAIERIRVTGFNADLVSGSAATLYGVN